MHKAGPIMEETHYYPFGLTMAGISSKAFGTQDNKHEYNGIEHNEALDINMYDARFRNFDPQIGRFWEIDPRPSDSVSMYAFAFNNPIRYADPLGDTAIVGINNRAAAGLGHQVLIFQDQDKNWFIYSAGAKKGDGQRLVSGGIEEGQVHIQPLTSENFIGLKEGTLSTSDVLSYLKDNKVGGYKLEDLVTLNTSQKQDKSIAANAAQSKLDFESGKKKYNLYSSNSSHAVLGVLNTNTGLDIPTATLPRNAHENVKEYSTIQYLSPQERKTYYYQKMQDYLRTLPD